jgi:T5SS/PEP-CTERM-associated repeat protein
MTNQRMTFGLCVAFVCILFFLPQPLSAGITFDPNGVGATDIDPADPTNWTSTTVYVGKNAAGTVLINGGSQVDAAYTYLGYASSSTGTVTVDGIGSAWHSTNGMCVGHYGDGALNITNGGLVSATGNLIIDSSIWIDEPPVLTLITISIDSDYYENDASDGFINITSGGMLALEGGDENDTLSLFLNRIDGDGIIQYWDTDIAGWANITGATYGDDYTLVHHTDGDLAGYTVLTVGVVPEPSTILLLATGLVGWFLVRRR